MIQCPHCGAPHRRDPCPYCGCSLTLKPKAERRYKLVWDPVEQKHKLVLEV